MPTSPGRPFTRRFKRASLLDLANRDSPKPMSSMKERRGRQEALPMEVGQCKEGCKELPRLAEV